MNDDVEHLLNRLTPRAAPLALRARVLEAVAAELATSPKPRRFPVGLATAAAVLVSVWLNHQASSSNDERLARIFGPRAISLEAADLARDVAEAAGPEAGRWILERTAAPPQPTSQADFLRHAADLRRMTHEPTLDPRERDDEATLQDIPQVGRDRDRRRPRRVLLVERRLHLEQRPKA